MQDAEKTGAETCRCPYCDAQIEETTAFCVACKTVIVDCAHCGEPVREGVETCPHCGEPPK